MSAAVHALCQAVFQHVGDNLSEDCRLVHAFHGLAQGFQGRAEVSIAVHFKHLDRNPCQFRLKLRQGHDSQTQGLEKLLGREWCEIYSLTCIQITTFEGEKPKYIASEP